MWILVLIWLCDMVLIWLFSLSLSLSICTLHFKNLLWIPITWLIIWTYTIYGIALGIQDMNRKQNINSRRINGTILYPIYVQLNELNKETTNNKSMVFIHMCTFHIDRMDRMVFIYYFCFLSLSLWHFKFTLIHTFTSKNKLWRKLSNLSVKRWKIRKIKINNVKSTASNVMPNK